VNLSKLAEASRARVVELQRDVNALDQTRRLAEQEMASLSA
jgi:hypothetical protein